MMVIPYSHQKKSNEVSLKLSVFMFELLKYIKLFRLIAFIFQHFILFVLEIEYTFVILLWGVWSLILISSGLCVSWALN